MRKIIYEGIEEGIYAYPDIKARIDGLFGKDSEIIDNVVEGYVIFEKEFTDIKVVLKYEGNIGQKAKVSLIGDKENIGKVEKMLNQENDMLLIAKKVSGNRCNL